MHASLPQAQVVNGALFIPAGVYRIRQVLNIRKSVVLRGAGRDLTTIYIPVSLTDVYGNTWSEVRSYSHARVRECTSELTHGRHVPACAWMPRLLSACIRGQQAAQATQPPQTALRFARPAPAAT